MILPAWYNLLPVRYRPQGEKDLLVMTGMRALEEWCRREVECYEGVNITNMSSAWKDGRGFCALIHRYRPDLLDWERVGQMDPERSVTLRAWTVVLFL